MSKLPYAVIDYDRLKNLLFDGIHTEFSDEATNVIVDGIIQKISDTTIIGPYESITWKDKSLSMADTEMLLSTLRTHVQNFTQDENQHPGPYSYYYVKREGVWFSLYCFATKDEYEKFLAKERDKEFYETFENEIDSFKTTFKTGKRKDALTFALLLKDAINSYMGYYAITSLSDTDSICNTSRVYVKVTYLDKDLNIAKENPEFLNIEYYAKDDVMENNTACTREGMCLLMRTLGSKMFTAETYVDEYNTIRNVIRTSLAELKEIMPWLN